MRRLLLALLLAAGAHLALAAPAAACSCASGPSGDQQYVDAASAVFVADFVAFRPPQQRQTMSSMDPAIWTFDVTGVYKGNVGARQDVVSAASSASCGLEIPHGGRVLVFAQAGGDAATRVDGPVLYAQLCGGTRPLAAAEMPDILGEPKPPLPGVRAAILPSPPDPAGTPSAATPSAANPSESAGGPARGAGVDWATVASVSTGATALFVVAGVVAVRRQKRESDAR